MAGTTSACAENTATGSAANPQSRNYLRVRGEYLSATVPAEAFDELPPRARRILQRAGQVSVGGGTTSACAENTFIELAIAGYIRNYLRVRGEYFTAFTQSGSCRELPPRARRIPTRENLIQQNRGTTSACAENTGGCLVLILHDGNYLRVRGEYRSKHVTRTHVVELPPRARRIPPQTP